jgi:hypothetical protein
VLGSVALDNCTFTSSVFLNDSIHCSWQVATGKVYSARDALDLIQKIEPKWTTMGVALRTGLSKP